MRLARMRVPPPSCVRVGVLNMNESVRRRARDFGNAGDGITLTGRGCIHPTFRCIHPRMRRVHPNIGCTQSCEPHPRVGTRLPGGATTLTCKGVQYTQSSDAIHLDKERIVKGMVHPTPSCPETTHCQRPHGLATKGAPVAMDTNGHGTWKFVEGIHNVGP